MKKLLFIIVCLSVLACKKSAEKPEPNKELVEKIHLLKQENLKLKDSISRIEENFLYSQILLGIPDEQVLTVGKENNIVMLFQTFNFELPNYEIYKIMDGKEIKIGANNQTRFEYKFTPKSITDNELELLIKLPYKGKVLKIPGRMQFDVKN